MEKWDINCIKCGRFILTEKKRKKDNAIIHIAGSYENGYYEVMEDAFYCKGCAKKYGLI